MLTIFHQTIESVVSLRAPISASRRKRNEHRREIKQTSKTGISSNPVVNAAIQEMARKALESGTGASATGTIPVLLKKRQDLEKSGGKEGIEDWQKQTMEAII